MTGSSKTRATPSKDTLAVVTSKVEHVILPEAVDKIYEIMKDSESEVMRFKAATWLAERFLSRAEKLGGAEQVGKVAEILADTLRKVMLDNPNSLGAIDGEWREVERELGKPYVLGASPSQSD